MEKCGICNRIIASSGEETWTLPSGIQVDLPAGGDIYCIASEDSHEVTICELCYKQRRFEAETWSKALKADVHFQFALEYRDRGRTKFAIDALHASLDMYPTAEARSELRQLSGDEK